MGAPKSKPVFPDDDAEPGLVRVPLSRLRPAPENEELYRPIQDDDPEIIAFAKSIRMHDIQEPLVISKDFFIISGHRRHAAARLAGLAEVPCRIEDISRELEPDRFLVLLREFNRQREKSLDERVREAIISSNPDDAREQLISERKQRSAVHIEPLVLSDPKARCVISDAKQPFLDAVLKVLDELREFWPVSERQIHYNLLNDPPLKHASKPDSIYRNDKASSKALSDLCTRALIEGLIPENAIGDETRPVMIWDCHRNVGDFIEQEINGFAQGYARDLMQSQRNHVELLVEKNTVAGILKSVAAAFTITMVSGRGFASLPPRIAMKNRFKKSGKEKLVIVLVSDFDASGECIADSFARSMRDDFDLEIHPIKAALTYGQINTMPDLPESVDVGDKATDSNAHYKSFKNKYGVGQKWYELEALDPTLLQSIIRDAIAGVIDLVRFNAEVRCEAEDARYVVALRKSMRDQLKTLKFQADRHDD